MNNIIEHTVAFDARWFEIAEAGHDWSHIQRVWNNTKLILEDEEQMLWCANWRRYYMTSLTVNSMMATKQSALVLRRVFGKSRISPEIIDHVKKIIFNMSFKQV
jgi:uncharacterized protein